MKETADKYAEMKKNTVSAVNQLQKSDYVYVEGDENTGKRIMFLGNSITLHGILPSIGWHNLWGMAASAKEKDYVHLTEAAVREIDPNAAFCICQAAAWERSYPEMEKSYTPFVDGKSFRPDIIVMRLMENCLGEGFDDETFRKSLDGFLTYLGGENVKVIMTTPFWHHPGEESIRILAREKGYPLVELGDLGGRDDMKAVGLFEHPGVANHPGDKGMQCISERIFEVLKTML